MNLYNQAAEGIYDQSDIKRLAWAGALADISAMFGGRQPHNLALSLPMQARQMREQQIQRQHTMKRQTELDALNRRVAESQIYKNVGSVNPNGLEPIGAPQKLDNGNLGVVVEDHNSPQGFRVVDTGTAFRGNPDLSEKLKHETDLYDLKERSKYQAVMGDSEMAHSSAETTLSGLYRAQQLVASGLETGDAFSVFAPDWWKSDDAQEYTALVNEQVLKASEALSGVLSENDMKFLQESTISHSKSPEANRRILERKIATVEKAKAEAQRKYDHFQGGGNFFNWKPIWQKSVPDSSEKPDLVYDPKTGAFK